MLGNAGKIVDLILKDGYSITDCELFHLDRNNAEEFLEVYKGVVPEYHVTFLFLISHGIISLWLVNLLPDQSSSWN